MSPATSAVISGNSQIEPKSRQHERDGEAGLAHVAAERHARRAPPLESATQRDDEDQRHHDRGAEAEVGALLRDAACAAPSGRRCDAGAARAGARRASGARGHRSRRRSALARRRARRSPSVSGRTAPRACGARHERARCRRPPRRARATARRPPPRRPRSAARRRRRRTSVDARLRGRQTLRRARVVGGAQRVAAGGRGEQLGERALVDDAAGADDRDAVAQLLDLGHQVAGEQHGDALVGEPPDQRAHVAHAGRVEAGRRLVEQQQPRVAQQRAGDAEPLAHAVRVAADPVLGAVGEVDGVERRVDARRRASSPSSAATSSRLRRPVRYG